MNGFIREVERTSLPDTNVLPGVAQEWLNTAAHTRLIEGMIRFARRYPHEEFPTFAQQVEAVGKRFCGSLDAYFRYIQLAQVLQGDFSSEDSCRETVDYIVSSRKRTVSVYENWYRMHMIMESVVQQAEGNGKTAEWQEAYQGFRFVAEDTMPMDEVQVCIDYIEMIRGEIQTSFPDTIGKPDSSLTQITRVYQMIHAMRRHLLAAHYPFSTAFGLHTGTITEGLACAVARAAVIPEATSSHKAWLQKEYGEQMWEVAKAIEVIRRLVLLASR